MARKHVSKSSIVMYVGDFTKAVVADKVLNMCDKFKTMKNVDSNFNGIRERKLIFIKAKDGGHGD